jgi:hypothetical protein
MEHFVQKREQRINHPKPVTNVVVELDGTECCVGLEVGEEVTELWSRHGSRRE